MHLLYTHHLSPYVFAVRSGGHTLGIRWYGLAYVFGFLLTFWYFRDAQRKKTIPGLSEEALENLLGAVVLGVLLGGRLGFVVQHPRELLADPLMVFRVWEGGMAFFGGLAGVAIALCLVARRYKLSLLALSDIAVFPAALGLAVGRIANFVNAELVGRPTGGHWGVIFPTVDNLPRHPSQLYESASHFLLFGILVLVAHQWPAWSGRVHGRLTALFLALYGLFRFVTDFYRADDMFLGPFSYGQWASLLVAVIGAVWLWRLRRRPLTTGAASPTHPPV
jgi:phosphatidylglycerol:prolipoprotein diacylglycerol transferase